MFYDQLRWAIGRRFLSFDLPYQGLNHRLLHEAVQMDVIQNMLDRGLDPSTQDPIDWLTGMRSQLGLIHDTLESAKVFRVSHERADFLYRLDSLSIIDPQRDLKLPFPVMFFEWDTPLELRLGGVIGGALTDWRVGTPMPSHTKMARGISIRENMDGTWTVLVYFADHTYDMLGIDVTDLPEFDFPVHDGCPAPCPLKNSRDTTGWTHCRSLGKRMDECIFGKTGRHVVRLAVNLLLLVLSPNVDLVPHLPSPMKRSRMKRIRKGKDAAPPPTSYYTVEIREHQRRASADAGSPTGRHVTYAFDVRGHFRRLRSGRLTWVQPHVRGIRNAVYRPSRYSVAKELRPPGRETTASDE